MNTPNGDSFFPTLPSFIIYFKYYIFQGMPLHPPRPDMLTELTDQETIRRYRLNKEGLVYLEGMIGASLSPRTARHNSLSAIEKILITLRFLASGEYQINDGDLHQVSQSTVSKVITEVLQELASPVMIQEHVRFPTSVHDLDSQVAQFS